MGDYSSVVKGVKNNYLQFDQLKGLTVDELLLVRTETLSGFTTIDNRIREAQEYAYDLSRLTSVRTNYVRVLGMVKNIIASKNRMLNDKVSDAKQKVKTANIRITELESALGKCKKARKALEIEVEEWKQDYKNLLIAYNND